MAPNLNLAHTAEEQTYFTNLADQRPLLRLQTLNTRAEVRAGLRAGTVRLWHFASHGSFDRINPDRSAITLEDGELYSKDIVGPIASGIKQSRPLMFFNACHTGRQDFALTGLAGWTQECIRAGSTVFIGTLGGAGRAGSAFCR